MHIKDLSFSGLTAYALNVPPGEYDRKVETQGNWRKLLQAVERVV